MVLVTIKSIPVGWRLFRHRLVCVPFESSLAIVAIWTGATSLLEYSVAARAFSWALPQATVDIFNLAYVLAGAFVLLGVGWGYRNVESSGLLMLFTVLTVRVFSLMVLVGTTPETVTAIVQGLTFGLATLLRLYMIIKGKTLVYAQDIPDIVAARLAPEHKP